MGVGSLYHLILENVQHLTGVKLVHVPYKGNSPLLTDLGASMKSFYDALATLGVGDQVTGGRVHLLSSDARKTRLAPGSLRCQDDCGDLRLP